MTLASYQLDNSANCITKYAYSPYFTGLRGNPKFKFISFLHLVIECLSVMNEGFMAKVIDFVRDWSIYLNSNFNGDFNGDFGRLTD